MESILNLFTATDTQLFILLGKAFAVLFSFLFLVYAVVLTRQTQIMNKTYSTRISGILQFISFLHVLFALVLIFISFVLI